MPRLTGRLTPSFAVSLAALTTALGGTALAAGELVTRPEQVADGVIESRHVADGTVRRADLERTYLRVRSSGKGELLGAGNDGTVVYEDKGQYLVTFPSLLPGPRGSEPIENCAVSATARSNPNPVNTTTMTIDLIPRAYNAVRIYASKPHHDLIGEFKRQDTMFDLVAVC